MIFAKLEHLAGVPEIPATNNDVKEQKERGSHFTDLDDVEVQDKRGTFTKCVDYPNVDYH